MVISKKSKQEKKARLVSFENSNVKNSTLELSDVKKFDDYVTRTGVRTSLVRLLLATVMRSTTSPTGIRSASTGTPRVATTTTTTTTGSVWSAAATESTFYFILIGSTSDTTYEMIDIFQLSVEPFRLMIIQ